jgi:hypothetical protein
VDFMQWSATQFGQKKGKLIGYLLKNIINIYNFLILCRSVTNKRTNNL